VKKHHHNFQGPCSKCDELFDLYPGFNNELRLWFAAVRSTIFDAHISCAGRGKVDQEELFNRGASHAHWGKSAHNYGMAIDLFRLDPSVPGEYSLDRRWFLAMFEAFPIGKKFFWFGDPRAAFKELPHLEVENWYDLVVTESIPLVEL
jgi:hypothetical protein